MRIILSALPILIIAAPAFAQGAPVTDPAAITADVTEPPVEWPTPSLSPASQEEESKVNVTAYSTVLTAYGFQDLGIIMYDKPVIQSGVTVTKGDFSVDFWSSSALSTHGVYGNRNYGDEFDLTVTYAKAIGPVKLTLSGAYFAAAPLNKTNDDIIQVSAQVETTVTVGPATVTPYVRVQQWLGVDSFPPDTFVRFGASTSVPVTAKLTLGFDLSDIIELDRGRHIARGEASLSRDFGGGWNGSLSVRFASHMKTVFGAGVSRTF